MDQVNAFMSYGSDPHQLSWCVLLVTDYYLVRGPLRIGSRGLLLDEVESVNWRGVATIAAVSAVNGVLYATGAVAVPFVTTAPMTAALYVGLSWLARDRVRAREAARRAAAGARDAEAPAAVDAAPCDEDAAAAPE